MEEQQNINEDHKIFLNHKNEIIKEFSKNSLDSEECNHIGKKILGSHWGGCFAWNKVHVVPNKYYIINTSSAGHQGIHWMALAVIGKTAYLWDSYNRSVKRLVPHLVRSLIKHGFKVVSDDHPMEQIGTSSEVCGHESLAWLMTVKDIGIKRASHV